MKTIILIAIALVSCASCTKTYICHCDDGESQVKVKKKKDAMQACKKLNPSVNCSKAVFYK